MAWRSHGSSNANLIQNLQNHGIIKTARVAAALLAVDRGDFVRNAGDAYYDSPSPIGHSATISAPHMHAYALELLQHKVQPGAKVLDVGSGSGYLCAAFAQMVQPGGKVYGIEHIPQLVSWSISNLRKHHGELLDNGTIDVRAGDGYLGLPQYGPFDAIHVGAAAPDVPQALIDQLAVGGEIIIPVGKYMQELVRGVKKADGRLEKHHLMGVMYVPLTERSKQDPGGMRDEAEAEVGQPQQAAGAGGCLGQHHHGY